VVYFLAWFVLVQSTNYGDNDLAFYWGLVGMAIYWGVLTYSGVTHETEPGRHEKLKTIAYCIMLACGLAPCAILYQSSFVGGMVVLAVEVALGFTAIADRLCYAVGFQSNEDVGRVIFASLGAMLLFSPTVFFSGNLQGYTYEKSLNAFAGGFRVVGVDIYFLALLIACVSTSGLHHNRQNRNELKVEDLRNIFAHLLMVASLGMCFFVGYVWNVESATYSGFVFLGLFLLEKYAEIQTAPELVAIKWFIFTGALAWCVFYIKAHPKLLWALVCETATQA